MSQGNVMKQTNQQSSQATHHQLQPKEWILVSTKSGKQQPLGKEMVFVGRSSCDVVLESPSIDNRHAVLCFNPKDASFYVKDLNTSHGTYINDVRVREQSYVRIHPQDSLRFGFSPESFILSTSSSLSSNLSLQSSPSCKDPPQSLDHPDPSSSSCCQSSLGGDNKMMIHSRNQKQHQNPIEKRQQQEEVPSQSTFTTSSTTASSSSNCKVDDSSSSQVKKTPSGNNIFLAKGINEADKTKSVVKERDGAESSKGNAIVVSTGIVEAAVERMRNKRFQSSSSVIFSDPRDEDQHNTVNVNKYKYQQHRNSHHQFEESHGDEIPVSMSQSTTTVSDAPLHDSQVDQMSVSCTAADFSFSNEKQQQQQHKPNSNGEVQCNSNPSWKTPSSIFGVEDEKKKNIKKNPFGNNRSQSVSDAVPVDSSPKPPATAFTISFDDDNENVEDKKKSFSLGDSLRKFAPRKKKPSFERGVNGRRSVRSASAAAGIDPSHQQESGPESLESTTMSSLPLTDSAAYLINKMLFSSEASPSSPIDPLLVPVIPRDEDEDVTPTAADEVPLVLPVVPPDSSSTHIVHQASKEMIPDTLSEAGTYTLDADGRNVDVEKARQMIDNVFGVARNATYSNVRQGMQSGSVPASPQPRRRTMRQQNRRNDSNCSNDSSGNNNTDDFRHRTFTRSKSGRRGSSSDNPSSPTFDTSQFDRVYNSRHYSAKQSLSSNVPRSPKLPVRNRQNSCSSSKSGGSNKTVDVKKGNVSIGAQA